MARPASPQARPGPRLTAAAPRTTSRIRRHHRRWLPISPQSPGSGPRAIFDWCAAALLPAAAGGGRPQLRVRLFLLSSLSAPAPSRRRSGRLGPSPAYPCTHHVLGLHAVDMLSATAGGASDGYGLGRGAAGPGRRCATTAAGALRVIV